jgi:glucose/arabinose dehydrogenase
MRLHRFAVCAVLLLVACGGANSQSTGATPPSGDATVEVVGSAAPAATEAALDATIAAEAPGAPATEAGSTETADAENATEAVETETAAAETATAAGATPQAAGEPLEVPIMLPDGFSITKYAENLGAPRFMAYSPDGVLHVTDIAEGRVLALPDANGDGVADSTDVVLEGLNQPHGIAFYEDALYIGETNQVVRFTRAGDGWSEPQVVVPDLPTGGHRTRTIIFGQDGKMYVSIGSSCNVCEEGTPLRAAVWQYDPDGSNGRLFTAGLRNAVGMIVRPGSNEIWATNNGRDHMGDDMPPETVNVLADGADFGWPRCHAGTIVDPQLGGENGCEGVAAPAVQMQAHSAPLGLRFYDGQMFPDEYQGDLFVAFHGSWNRSVPTGYKIVRVPINDDGTAGEVEDFASGWLQSDGTDAGRPVDVIVAPDGALLVSDDEEGQVYRIAYGN